MSEYRTLLPFSVDVIGIDLSPNISGYCVIRVEKDNIRMLESTTIKEDQLTQGLKVVEEYIVQYPAIKHISLEGTPSAKIVDEEDPHSSMFILHRDFNEKLLQTFKQPILWAHNNTVRKHLFGTHQILSKVVLDKIKTVVDTEVHNEHIADAIATAIYDLLRLHIIIPHYVRILPLDDKALEYIYEKALMIYLYKEHGKI